MSQDNYIEHAGFYIPRNTYSKSYVEPLWGRANNASKTGRKYTNDNILKLLTDPYRNYKALQEISHYFWYTSPFYQNIIYYLATIMSFDYLLYPYDIPPMDRILENRLFSSAQIVKNINVKTSFPSILARALVNGETYWYDLAEGKNEFSIIQEIPSRYCQLAFIDDKTGFWRYFVNLSFIKKESLVELPPEITEAYENYKSNKDKNKKIKNDELDAEIPANLYLVSPKGFSVFIHKQKSQHDYPFLSSMFIDINTLEDNKDYMDEYLKESNIKLVHFKVPTDKDTGKPLMDKDLVEIYHNSAKEHLPKSTAPLTNPFETEALSFDKVKDAVLSVLDNSKKTVQWDSGVSSTLFESNTTNGLKFSIEVDASKMYPLLSYFEDYVNYKMAKQKFGIRFLKIHQGNRADWHKQYSTDLQNGGQRSLFIATNGLELYDSLMISKMEKVLDFDSYLPPKINANQISGNEVGNPGLDDDEKADGTIVGDGYK